MSNCSSWLRCGSVCGWRGFLNSQMSSDTRHKILLWTFSNFASCPAASGSLDQLLESIKRKAKATDHFPFHNGSAQDGKTSAKCKALVQRWFNIWWTRRKRCKGGQIIGRQRGKGGGGLGRQDRGWNILTCIWDEIFTSSFFGSIIVYMYIPYNCRWRGWRRQCKFFWPV